MSDRFDQRLRDVVDRNAPPLSFSELSERGPTAPPKTTPIPLLIAGGVAVVAMFTFLGWIGPGPTGGTDTGLAPPEIVTTTAPGTSAPLTTLPSGSRHDLVPREIAPEFILSPDWERVADPPIDMRNRQSGVAAWTGTEVVIWGGGGPGLSDGASYDPASGTWRLMPPAPFDPQAIERFPGWVWTGDELVVWTPGGHAAAWTPSTNTWRDLGVVGLQAGSFSTRAVWTGTEIIDTLANIAFDPSSGSVRPIASPGLSGMAQERSRAVWVGDHVLLTPMGPLYEPQADTWGDIPDLMLSINSTDGAAIGRTAISADYLGSTVILDLETRTWEPGPNLPFDAGECPVFLQELGGSFFVDQCDNLAIFDTDGRVWIPSSAPLLATDPDRHRSNRYIGTETHIYAYGDSGIWRQALDRTDIWSSTRRVGNPYQGFDIPQGWLLGPPRGEERYRLDLPEGGECSVISVPSGLQRQFTQAALATGSVIEVSPRFGGAPYRAVWGEDGGPSANILLWAEPGPSLTINCSNREDSANLLAHGLWVFEEAPTD